MRILMWILMRCKAAGMCISPRPYNKALLLKQADQAKIALAVSQQVALVGSQSLYDKINKNFKENGFDAIFAKVKQFSSFLYYISYHWARGKVWVRKIKILGIFYYYYFAICNGFQRKVT